VALTLPPTVLPLLTFSIELVIYYGHRNQQRNHACAPQGTRLGADQSSPRTKRTRMSDPEAAPGHRSESPQRVGCRPISCVIGAGAASALRDKWRPSYSGWAGAVSCEVCRRL